MEKVLVRLENVSKKYNDKFIIKNLDLDVYEGEFLTLLGASGCGKTTILRMISGLEEVTSGKVIIDGVDVTNLDPTKREVNTIFQNLALFPHLTVEKNIAFGLKMKKVPQKEIDKKVNHAIKLVKLEGLENRLPSQLSGGQQQRVAIARGIVMNPKVLLLDESLCSLDLKLKRKMQIELKKIQKKLGITFIYVTHDQDEALTMSDRIVILNNGIIEQIDTPQNIYKYPNTTFVADFIGESNIIESTISNISEDEIEINLQNSIKLLLNKDKDYTLGEKIYTMIRPENIKISKNPLKEGIAGIIKEIVYDGAFTKLLVKINDQINLKITTCDDNDWKQDEEVYVKLDKDEIVIIRNKNEKKN